MLLVLLCAALVGAGATDVTRALTGAARFSVSSSVLLSDTAAVGGELGWRTQAHLVLRAQPAEGGLILHFTLESPKLMLRGKHRNAEFLPKPSLWDSMPSSSFLAVWKDGAITAAYLDPEDPPDVLDYKKALISLFQFQLEEGERNETDVSGVCHVHYEAVSDLVFRKSKMQCTWQGAHDEDEQDGCAERRRVTRVELATGGGLLALAADEVLLLRGADRTHALKARALHTLSLAGQPAPAQLPLDLAEARALQPALTAHALPLEPRADGDEPEQSLESAVLEHRAAIEESSAGSARAAAAMLKLLPALRAASAQRLIALLDHPDTEELEGLIRALGLAGARGPQLAAREALQLAAADPPREALGREYLAALSLAPQVEEWVVRDTLKLGAGAARVAPAALLAAAAASHNVPESVRATVATDVKNTLTKGLSKCKDNDCKATYLHALGQLRRADLSELFLEHAEKSGRVAALAAIAALQAGPSKGYFGMSRRRLEGIALSRVRPRPLDVRAAALQLALLSAADHPAALAPMIAELRKRGPRELRAVCWQRLLQLAATREELSRLLQRLDPRPRDWTRRAVSGTSSVLERSFGWATLDSAQLASGGVLSRGRVQLTAHNRAGHEDLLTVELWTRGLESFASPPPVPAFAREAEDEAEAADAEAGDVEGGLALTVGGVRRPDVILFNGQGELLGHIWSGSGSSPTAVLRAVWPRAHVRHTYALQAGLLLRGHVEQAVAMAQDAQAQVSLWGRTARAGLSLVGAGADTVTLHARTAWGQVRATAHTTVEPQLHINAALDFYDKPQLCVHTYTPDHTYSRNVTLESTLGSTSLRVRRVRVTSQPVPGRTLALGAPNDGVCADIGAEHKD